MNFNDEEFKKFISPDCNRMTFIVEYLQKRGVKAVVMPIQGRNHIYVVFPSESYSPLYNIKTVIAHYDRFENSPGANDNSSSVYILLNWAVQLYESRMVHNIRLIFTDGEELGSGNNGTTLDFQGAFGLAGVFKRLNIINDDVYVFDCVGRGTVPVLQRTILSKKTPVKMQKRFGTLFARTQSLLQAAGKGTWVTLPVSYSDNAGFLVHGIAAVAITMLPQNEASEYMYALLKDKDLENYVTNKIVPEGRTVEELEKYIPQTWKKLHSGEDNILSLTQESIPVMERILSILADLKTLV